MDAAVILKDAFSRVGDDANAVLDGLDEAMLTARVGPEANTIAWLIWHLTRVQDDHIADAAGRDQVWSTQGFAERFALPFGDSESGYGFSTEQVGQVRGSATLFAEYLDAVQAQTLDYFAGLSEADLDRIVDTRWDPPVTLGVRLVSILNDDLQHVGQAAYVRGLLTN